MNQENFITEYCQILDESHGQRPDILWFSTWMASKSPYFNFAKKWERFWVKNEYSSPLTIFEKIRRILRLSVTLLSLIGKSMFLKWVYRDELRELRNLKTVNVVRTFLFTADARVPDPFWGKLIHELEDSTTPLLILFEPQFSIFQCKQTYSAPRRNFPYQVFLSPIPLVQHFIRLVREAFRKFHFSGSYKQKNPQISKIFDDNYQEELLAPAALTTLAFYDCFQSVAQRFEIQNFLIPYENNPWEKMLYLSRKKLNQKFQIIGYQHATVQKDATNYNLSQYEVQREFHPNVICCVGPVTLELLKNKECYKNINVREACALRYTYLEKRDADAVRRSASTRYILVTLDGTLETIGLLKFMLEYAKNYQEDRTQIFIKEHPNMRIKNFAPQLMNHPSLISGHVQIRNESTEALLKDCDVLVYEGTTVSLEALALGLPLIRFDNSLFNFDPLYSFKDFKYIVKTFEDVTVALKSLESLSLEERNRRSELGKKYVSRYFSPCTPEALKRFLMA